MASELSMNGRKKIETLQKEFTQKFPYLTLVFLDKERRAIDISKSLSEVRQAKGADISIIASLKVNTLEKRFLENFGLVVEVAYQKSDKVVYTKDNVDKTLNELNKWCQENDCQTFEFKKSLTGNTLSSVQEQLFEAIKEYYPNAEAKKINKDNYLDIHIPEINNKRGTHLFFNTAKDGIKIGFYCREEDFVEEVLSKSSNIEKYAQGIRILNNPLQNGVEAATASALSFIGEITGEQKNNSGVDLKAKLIIDFTEKFDLNDFLGYNLTERPGKMSVYEITTKQMESAINNNKLDFEFEYISSVDLNDWDALSRLIGKKESLENKKEYSQENINQSGNINFLYCGGTYVYSVLNSGDGDANESNLDDDDLDKILRDLGYEEEDTNEQDAESSIIEVPDANFKNYLISNKEINPNGNKEILLSEAAAFTGDIDCIGLNIADLTGIEAFTALTHLRCDNNKLSSLDLSSNTALTYLHCGNNKLSSLDVSANTGLIYLFCEGNELSNLDISSNASLRILRCSNNQLSSLDVSANAALADLNCDNNQLTNLDLSANPNLYELNCCDNELESLDLSANRVYFLSCMNNYFDSDALMSQYNEEEDDDFEEEDDEEEEDEEEEDDEEEDDEEEDDDEEDDDFEEDDDDEDDYFEEEDEEEEDDEEAIFNWVCIDINLEKRFNISCSSLYSISENLFCFQIGEKFGVVDSNGKIIVPCKYDQIFQYNNNLARVQTGGRWTGKYGFIDMKGHEIVSCKYEDADEFCDDLARVKINDKWGFIDKNGKEVIPLVYSFVKNFSEGLAGVTIDELYGFIDKNNTLKIEYQFDDIEEFKDGFSIVRMGGKSIDGEYVRGKLGLINREGKIISDCKYNRIDSFTDNFALVTIGGNQYGLGQTYGFINREGEEIIPCKYDSADNFKNGITIVLSNEDYFFINLKQDVVLKVKYEYVNNFYDNLAVVSENDKYGYINKAGDLVIGFIYDDALNFNSGFAFIEVNNNWGVIDTNGKEVVKPTFEEIELVPNSKYFIVKTNEKYKLINTSDFIHSEDEFDEIKYSDDGNFMFGKLQELETEIEDKEEGVNQLSKKELYSAIWDIIGGYLFNYSYITWVDKEEAEYIESRGLGCEILEEDDGKAKIKIKIENYIDTNFNKDLIDNFNIDKLKGNKLYKATEIENWIDKCLSNLCDLFSSFTVLGGEELYPEDGDTAWDNENTIYLQVPYKEFKLTDLNESWNESQYFLSNEKLSSFIDELNN